MVSDRNKRLVLEIDDSFCNLEITESHAICYMIDTEAQTCSTTRHAREWNIRVGATKDGIIQVIDMDSITDAGAHATHCFTTTTAGEHKSVPLYNKATAVHYGTEGVIHESYTRRCLPWLWCYRSFVAVGVCC